MRKSPLHRLANAKFWIESLAPESTMDRDEDGNLRINVQRTEYSAYCKQDSRASIHSLPGVGVNRLFVRGYLTDPLDLPEGLHFPLNIEAEVDGILGHLELQPQISSPVGAHRKIGRKFSGWFTWGDSQ